MNEEKIYREAIKIVFPKGRVTHEGYEKVRLKEEEIVRVALHLQENEIMKKIDSLPEIKMYKKVGNPPTILINKDELKVSINKSVYKILDCKKCKRKTLHLKCGFGEPGGLCGNGRWRCLNCKMERK